MQQPEILHQLLPSPIEGRRSCWTRLSILCFVVYGLAFTSVAAIRTGEPYVLLATLALLVSASVSMGLACAVSASVAKSKLLHGVAPIVSICAVLFLFEPVYFAILRMLVNSAPPLPSSELSAFGVNSEWLWHWLTTLLVVASSFRSLAASFNQCKIASMTLKVAAAVVILVASIIATVEFVRVLAP